MVQETVLGGIVLGLEGTEESLFGTEDLDGGGGVLGQVHKGTYGKRDEKKNKKKRKKRERERKVASGEIHVTSLTRKVSKVFQARLSEVIGHHRQRKERERKREKKKERREETNQHEQ